MSLVIFNGSPRGTGSNSKLMADSFLKGFAAESNEESKVFYLIKKKVVRSFSIFLMNLSIIINKLLSLVIKCLKNYKE